jgi:hypothetical protein
MSIIEYSQDLSTAEAPPPLPAGVYPAEIISVSEREGQLGRYLSIVFRINPESYPADFTDGDPDGTELMYNRLQLDDNGKNRFRMKRFLQRIGAPLSNKIDPNSLIGLTATVEVNHREWEEEQLPNIVRILAP